MLHHFLLTCKIERHLSILSCSTALQSAWKWISEDILAVRASTTASAAYRVSRRLPGGKQAETCVMRKIAHFVEVMLSKLLSGLSYLYKLFEHVKKYSIFCSSRKEKCWFLCCTQSITFVSLFAMRIPWEIRRVFFCNECSMEIANLPCEAKTDSLIGIVIVRWTPK